MYRKILRSLIFLTSMLLCSPAYASSEVQSINEVEAERKDPLTWQIGKDFQEEMLRFTALADREFHWLVNYAIDKIDAEEEFFIRRREVLLEKLRTIIFNWLFDKVLGKQESCDIPSDYEEESRDESYDYPSSPYNTEDEITDESECLEQSLESDYKEWQRWELLRVLGVFVGSIDDFTKEMIDIDAIKKFLSTNVQGGRKYTYSWLINDIIGGSLLTTEDFVSLLFDKAYCRRIKELSASFKRKTFAASNTRLVEGLKDALCYLLHNDMFYDGCYFDSKELKRLGITKKTTRESLNDVHLKTFLRYCVNNPDNSMVKWACEGTAVEDYIWSGVGIPKKLLENIIDGLWFDYDWEQLDIAEPLFVANTYKATLVALRDEVCADDVKEHIVSSLKKLFTFNEHDFEGALGELRTNFNRYVERHDLLGAFVEWSIYCAYRKEFAASVQLKSLSVEDGTESLLPQFVKANKERSLVKKTNEARKRALEKYTKVYLHEDTSTLVFKDDQGRRATLLMSDRLAYLKQVGKAYEGCRPKGSSQNVFVPELYLVLQRADGNGDPFFEEMPLLTERLGLIKRPVTRHIDDGVFVGDRADIDSGGYFVLPKKDYVKGRVLQGCTDAKALEKIESILSSGMRNERMIHSERVIMELLRNREILKVLVALTVENLLETHGGDYTVHGVVMLSYSTNSVCPCCTPTLISLMNSHEEGFLQILMQELQAVTGDIEFLVPLNEEGSIDREKVRCTVVVTAKKNFDLQADDMTEEDQQSQINTSHLNTKAQLRRPNNELVISDALHLDDATIDPKQRCFYEFVGKMRHVHEDEEELTASYDKVVCSSGGAEVWKKVPAYQEE